MAPKARHRQQPERTDRLVGALKRLVPRPGESWHVPAKQAGCRRTQARPFGGLLRHPALGRPVTLFPGISHGGPHCRPRAPRVNQGPPRAPGRPGKEAFVSLLRKAALAAANRLKSWAGVDRGWQDLTPGAAAGGTLSSPYQQSSWFFAGVGAGDARRGQCVNRRRQGRGGRVSRRAGATGPPWGWRWRMPRRASGQWASTRGDRGGAG